MTISEYKKALKLVINRIKTKKKFLPSQYKLVDNVKEYLFDSQKNIDDFDYHLRKNTNVYKKCVRQNIRIDTFLKALNHHILVKHVSMQYKFIK